MVNEESTMVFVPGVVKQGDCALRFTEIRLSKTLTIFKREWFFIMCCKFGTVKIKVVNNNPLLPH